MSFFSYKSAFEILRVALMLALCLVTMTLSRASADELESENKRLYLASCYILDHRFEIIKLLSNHWTCQVKEDGGWYATDNRSLSNYDATGKILWKLEGDYHHQIRVLNQKEVIVLKATAHRIEGQLIHYDLVQILSAKSGRVLREFSLYKELEVNKGLKGSHLDKKLLPIAPFMNSYKEGVRFEKTHLNSISLHKDQIVVNELRGVAFVLDKNLKFLKFVDFPTHKKMKFYAAHDFQILEPQNYLFFSNFSHGEKTFKIFEFKNGEAHFEFPTEKKDYIPVGCCGGVQKIGTHYLVGFPGKTVAENFSTVGLVSSKGQWLIKKQIPTRIQDIRMIPYSNYLEKHKVR